MGQIAAAYDLGGITLLSEILLPELPEVQPHAFTAHPVNVWVVENIEQPSGAVELDPDCFATATQFFLRIPGLASYRVDRGSQILVRAEPGASPLDVRAYLLGTLFIVLCQQRGLLPIHASAITNGNGVIAFVGRSGHGKSSLAAHLAQRGFSVVGDDVCLIDPATN